MPPRLNPYQLAMRDLDKNRMTKSFTISPSNRRYLDNVKAQIKKERYQSYNIGQDQKSRQDELQKKVEDRMAQYKSSYKQDLRYQNTYKSPLVKQLRKIRRTESKESKLRKTAKKRKLKDKSYTISSSMIRLDDLVETDYDANQSMQILDQNIQKSCDSIMDIQKNDTEPKENRGNYANGENKRNGFKAQKIRRLRKIGGGKGRSIEEETSEEKLERIRNDVYGVSDEIFVDELSIA